MAGRERAPARILLRMARITAKGFFAAICGLGEPHLPLVTMAGQRLADLGPRPLLLPYLQK
ncbi:hypothetical protein CU048_10650 [Beijerinckiaceae bacterium]|nr:hypothetical protein CU048_10650 [Beijerinckiaceae bacterium]